MDWKFADPPNVAVFTTRKILNGKDWIASVFHDADDGAWQFLGAELNNSENLAVVALSEVVDFDPSVVELAELPMGWHAWRTAKNDAWHSVRSN
jgi:hypothetical protein